jgi:hypothetical protein
VRAAPTKVCSQRCRTIYLMAQALDVCSVQGRRAAAFRHGVAEKLAGFKSHTYMEPVEQDM